MAVGKLLSSFAAGEVRSITSARDEKALAVDIGTVCFTDASIAKAANTTRAENSPGILAKDKS